jgi:diadenylate cyclase
MRALNFILENFFQVGMIAIIVIFQSDLRAALERFGSTKIKDFRGISESDAKAIVNTAEIIAEAADALSKNKTGALIVVERSTKLGEHLSHGVILNADMSSLLIRNVFYDKAPMHDGAVIVRHGRVKAAGCMLPLSKNVNLSRDLGMRHRAGIGMSENSDAVIVIVSEESGSISVATGGMLKRHLKPETLENLLRNELLPQDELGEDKQKFSFSAILNLIRAKQDGGADDE